MQTENTTSSANRADMREPSGSRTGRIFAGLLILTIGVLFLLRQMGFEVPFWVMSWPLIIIGVGLYIGFRHSFRGPVWIIVTLVGTMLFIDRIEPSFDFHRYIWPSVIIAIGLVILLRPKKKYTEPVILSGAATGTDPVSADDLIDSVTVFGGVKKKIISKSFSGGEITTIFGGTEIDLTQADVPGRITLELTQIFGGTKLIVPPHWRIHSEDLVSIFGGLDDKRPAQVPGTETTRVLVLRGTCIFGGIDIKSY